MFFKGSSNESQGRTSVVNTGTVTSTVTASGTVESSGNHSLYFKSSGIVNTVNVKVGQKVKAGKVLATLDNSTATQQLASAKSGYAQSLANLSAANLSLSDAALNASNNAASYKLAVDKAKRDLDDAQAAAAPECSNPQSTSCSNISAWTTLLGLRNNLDQAKRDLTKAQNQAALNLVGYTQSISTAVTQADIDKATNARDKGVLADQATIDSANSAIYKANLQLMQQQDAYARAVTTAQTAYDTALLNEKKGREADQQAIRKIQQSQAASTTNQGGIDSALGVESVAKASADASAQSLRLAQENYNNTILRAPVSGVIGVVNISSGLSSNSASTAGASSPAVILVSKGTLSVKANFNEADAAKVQLGQSATVTFSALSGTTVQGTVVSTSPVGTTTNGLTTYPVEIQLIDAPDTIRAGMSANVSVITEQVEGALFVPSTAITKVAGNSTVTVRVNGVDTATPVTTGLIGDSGTEILSGLKAGDAIVLPNVTTGSGNNGFPSGGIPGGSPLGGVGGPPSSGFQGARN